MTSGLALLLALCIGVVAGLRSLTAPAVVAWAAHLGWINLHGSPLAFMGSPWAVGVFTVLALGELVADLLPSTPARTAPVGLSARIVTGALAGLLFSQSPTLARIMNPFVVLFNATPRIALVPIFVIIAGPTLIATSITAVLVVFFLVFVITIVSFLNERSQSTSDCEPESGSTAFVGTMGMTAAST